MYLNDFVVVHPPFHFNQEEGLDWLARMHVEAEAMRNPSLQKEAFLEEVRKTIGRVCCKKESISRRFVSTEDMMHQDYGRMSLYNLQAKGAEASDFGERGRFYAKAVDAVFEEFYPEKATVPDDLIHVTCTGYNAPSAAQKLAARRSWPTTVTHVYHMGCAGAMPAVRIASGYGLMGRKRVDIVHTELSSIHFNPTLHAADQFVGQSLFADGFIKYSLSPAQNGKVGLRVLAFHEAFIPQSEELMKWECEPWGLKMTLSKEIPILIGQTIASFVSILEEKSGKDLKEAKYAIHPGGPKIIDHIQKKLSLTDHQVEETRQVLFERGNMSSATLPHIWERILKDTAYPTGSLIVGLAFAPGLCVSGIVLRKEKGDDDHV